MRSLALILFVVTVLSSCNGNKNQTPVVGSTDSTAIAVDTMTQKAIENSTEDTTYRNPGKKL